ncbi:MAG: copper resistance protein CopC [Thermomicrobiales bacterium]|nr:copper resistance protein CopC [Thermomicrobiales bacterium]
MLRNNAVRAFLALAFVLGFSLVLTGGAAIAHADLESSNPAAESVVEEAPAEVEVVFSSEVQAGSTIEVFGPDGAPVHAGEAVLDLNDPDRRRATVALQPNLPAGVYTVNWMSASTDGHNETGSFTFTVSAGATASPIASPAATPEASPGAMTEQEVKEQLHEIADRAQQQATAEAAAEDPLNEWQFLMGIGVGAVVAVLIYLFWRKVRPSDAERVY